MTFLAASRTLAHAFGARYDLPLPLGLYLAAAGMAVAASFLGALFFLRAGRARPVHLDIPIPARVGHVLSTVLGIFGVLGLAILLGAAFSGPQEAVRNLATVGVWVIWWVGFVLFSALVVCLWPQVDPFRRLAALLARVAGRPWGSSSAKPPSAAGLLAPTGLLALAWIELVSDWSEEPYAVGLLVIAYILVALLGGLAYGKEWFCVVDPLSRIFAVLARLAPICVASRTALRLRPPGEGLLQRTEPVRGEVALITALIGIVLFDGLSETPVWAAVLDFVSGSQSLRPQLLWLRAQGADLIQVIRTIGLFTTIAGFYGAYWLLIVLMQALAGGGLTISQLAREFVGTLLPIAVAYHLSHYISYLLIAGQLIFPAASDPFGLGWDVFGTRNWSIDISIIGAKQVWWIAFTALIAGHALSVLVAHRRAILLFKDKRRAALSQIPMTIAMVGLTVLSLWILSQPLTE
ncbi:hypothetical protein QQF73_15185 [Marinobacter sp. M216]|uniref:Fenitrothion hydrolase n=1 Tax=Marinobacter albus TaxID=3030833 RepID=A0ABT7HF33_9GAMM|nr:MULTISPECIES: hypothetical protein [unclassified Marinobacter]MBW7472427.1 hypothetical protein [Marinobacter sp. F4218]MDK9558977.1 hypothetical protein [Marinobacter sp. M216]